MILKKTKKKIQNFQKKKNFSEKFSKKFKNQIPRFQNFHFSKNCAKNYLYEDYRVSTVESDLSGNSDFLRVHCVSDQPLKAFQANLSYQLRVAERDEG